MVVQEVKPSRFHFKTSQKNYEAKLPPHLRTPSTEVPGKPFSLNSPIFIELPHLPDPATQQTVDRPYSLEHNFLSSSHPPSQTGEKVPKPLTPLHSDHSPWQKIHEEKQYHVEEDEEPEIQPVGVFGRQGGPGLRPHFVVLLLPLGFTEASPLPGAVPTTFWGRVHLHFAPVAAPESGQLKSLSSRTSAFSLRKSGQSPAPCTCAFPRLGKGPRPVPPSAQAPSAAFVPAGGDRRFCPEAEAEKAPRSAAPRREAGFSGFARRNKTVAGPEVTHVPFPTGDWLHLGTAMVTSPYPSIAFASLCQGFKRASSSGVCTVPSMLQGFPCGSDGEASAYTAGGLGSIPGSGRSSGEGNGTPLQYS